MEGGLVNGSYRTDNVSFGVVIVMKGFRVLKNF